MNVDNERGVDNEGEINVEAPEESESEVTVEVRLDNNRCEEDNSMINELVDVMENGLDEDTRGLKKVDRGVVRQWTRKVNEVIKDIKTETITDTNRLIHAVSIYIAKVGLRTWWKRKIKGSIEELRRHLNILERNRRGELRKKEKYNELTRKYKIREKGEAVILEELKQRLQAKAAKLKRYEQRIEQYRLNGLFQQDQKRVYQELNGEMKTEGTVPDADESKQFGQEFGERV